MHAPLESGSPGSSQAKKAPVLRPGLFYCAGASRAWEKRQA